MPNHTDYQAAARNRRYAARRRSADRDAVRAVERRRDSRQRQRLIGFLDGECRRCGLRDHRGLVVVQPAGQRLTLHQLYTLMLHEPQIAAAELRLLCATCRQIEVFEYGRTPHQPLNESPSMSSAEVHPSASDCQPSSSFGGGAARDADWFSDVDGVAFG